MRNVDGSGSGVAAKVNADNKLATTAVAVSPQFHASASDGQAFQVVSGIRATVAATPYGILAIRNDGQLNLVLTYIRVGIDQVEVAQAELGLFMGGVWVAGTDTEPPVNLNGRFSLEADVTAHYNAIPTGSKNIDRRWMRGPDEAVWRKEGAIILPTNSMFSIQVTPVTNAVNAHARISFILLSDDELESC